MQSIYHKIIEIFYILFSFSVFETGVWFTLTAHPGREQPPFRGATATSGEWPTKWDSVGPDVVAKMPPFPLPS